MNPVDTRPLLVASFSNETITALIAHTGSANLRTRALAEQARRAAITRWGDTETTGARNRLILQAAT